MTAPVQKTVTATVADDCTEARAAVIRSALQGGLPVTDLVTLVVGYAMRLLPSVIPYRQIQSYNLDFQRVRDGSYKLLKTDNDKTVTIHDCDDATERTFTCSKKGFFSGICSVAMSENEFFFATEDTFEVAKASEGSIAPPHSSEKTIGRRSLTYDPLYSICFLRGTDDRGLLATYQLEETFATYRPGETIRSHACEGIDFVELISANTLITVGQSVGKIENYDNRGRSVTTGYTVRNNREYCISITKLDPLRSKLFVIQNHVGSDDDELLIFSTSDLTRMPSFSLGKDTKVSDIGVNSYALGTFSGELSRCILYDVNVGQQLLSFNIEKESGFSHSITLSDNVLGLMADPPFRHFSKATLFDLRVHPSKPINGPPK